MQSYKSILAQIRALAYSNARIFEEGKSNKVTLLAIKLEYIKKYVKYILETQARVF